MKKYILLSILTILLVPNLATADQVKTIEIKGVIGDYAPEARMYEVNGKMYEFEEDIAIQSQAGEILTFADLKGGMRIKIIGEKIPGLAGKEKIKYTNIIVMNKKVKSSGHKGL